MAYVVAVADLSGAAVTPAVEGDDSIDMIEEEQHLGVPIIGRQRPIVTEHDRLPVAPILVDDFHAIGGDQLAKQASPLFVCKAFAVSCGGRGEPPWRGDPRLGECGG